MTTNDTPDLGATIDEAEQLRELAADECATSSEVRRLVRLLPPLLSAARLAQELTALLGELYPYNGAPSPVEQLKEVIAQSLGYSEAFDRGRALERETTESLRAALAEKEAESARLRELVAELERTKHAGIDASPCISSASRLEQEKTTVVYLRDGTKILAQLSKTGRPYLLVEQQLDVRLAVKP